MRPPRVLSVGRMTESRPLLCGAASSLRRRCSTASELMYVLCACIPQHGYRATGSAVLRRSFAPCVWNLLRSGDLGCIRSRYTCMCQVRVRVGDFVIRAVLFAFVNDLDRPRVVWCVLCGVTWSADSVSDAIRRRSSTSVPSRAVSSLAGTGAIWETIVSL